MFRQITTSIAIFLTGSVTLSNANASAFGPDSCKNLEGVTHLPVLGVDRNIVCFVGNTILINPASIGEQHLRGYKASVAPNAQIHWLGRWIIDPDGARPYGVR